MKASAGMWRMLFMWDNLGKTRKSEVEPRKYYVHSTKNPPFQQ